MRRRSTLDRGPLGVALDGFAGEGDDLSRQFLEAEQAGGLALAQDMRRPRVGGVDDEEPVAGGLSPELREPVDLPQEAAPAERDAELFQLSRPTAPGSFTLPQPMSRSLLPDPACSGRVAA